MPSTAIRSLSYDDQTATLFVTFVDGDLYAYFETPASVYRAFRAARSKGRFFASEIRNRYRYRRLDGPEEAPSPDPGSAGPASRPRAGAGRSA
ncbi:MAG TPA: KTSC domain-containing protein [Caulobacteraceae bacterium]|nr:KTSC domain-containing protein [Caulobacteraceae bacterium]